MYRQCLQLSEQVWACSFLGLVKIECVKKEHKTSLREHATERTVITVYLFVPLKPTQTEMPSEQSLGERKFVQLARMAPTVDWSTENKSQDMVATVGGQNCALDRFHFSEQRMGIHVRQHCCIQFCHCG